MSPASIIGLGAIAGGTIFLGLPLGRMKAALPRTKTLFNGTAIGILTFLLWDVLSQAWAPIDGAVSGKRYAAAAGYGVVMAAGFAAGLVGLVYYDQWMARRLRNLGSGPGTALLTDLRPRPLVGTPARRLALFIAVGIGLHNFSEGLAIGQSAAAGEIGLAVLLVVGFALHNATEGFGIVAPFAMDADRPSWRTLALLGLIGGGPTFLGTILGRSFVSPTLSLAFLALAAGSILYVVIELLAVGRKLGLKTVLTWGLILGVVLGFVTDAIVTASGV